MREQYVFYHCGISLSTQNFPRYSGNFSYQTAYVLNSNQFIIDILILMSKAAKKTGKSLFSTEADDEVDLKHKQEADLHRRFCMNLLQSTHQPIQSPQVWSRRKNVSNQPEQNSLQNKLFNLGTKLLENKAQEKFENRKNQQEEDESIVVYRNPTKSRTQRSKRPLRNQQMPQIFAPSIDFRLDQFPSFGQTEDAPYFGTLSKPSEPENKKQGVVQLKNQNQANYYYSQSVPIYTLVNQINSQPIYNKVNQINPCPPQSFYQNQPLWYPSGIGQQNLPEMIARIEQALVNMFQILQQGVQHQISQNNMQILYPNQINDPQSTAMIDEDTKVIEYMTNLFRHRYLQGFYSHYQQLRKQVKDLEQETLIDQAICNKFEQLDKELQRLDRNNEWAICYLSQQYQILSSTLAQYNNQLDSQSPTNSKYNITEQRNYVQQIYQLEQQMEHMYLEMHPQPEHQNHEATKDEQLINANLLYIHQILTQADHALSQLKRIV